MNDLPAWLRYMVALAAVLSILGAAFTYFNDEMSDLRRAHAELKAEVAETRVESRDQDTQLRNWTDGQVDDLSDRMDSILLDAILPHQANHPGANDNP